jgi:putative ABC transport system ATP-binding protein
VVDLLVADSITRVADGRPVVDAVSLRLQAGESVALIGPSGSGKTTLLNILGGLLPPHSGRVLFKGEQLDSKSDERRSIASVFQTYGLFPLLTATENIEIAMRAVGSAPDEARAVAEEALAGLALGPFAQHLTQELSGGQEQRVAVARALAIRPKVILADEPTTEQDQDHRNLVVDRLLEVTTHGPAILIATHDEGVAQRCDRIFEMNRGKVTELSGRSSK